MALPLEPPPPAPVFGGSTGVGWGTYYGTNGVGTKSAQVFFDQERAPRSAITLEGALSSVTLGCRCFTATASAALERVRGPVHLTNRCMFR